MKRIGAFSLAIFIFVLSVFSVIPVYADGDKTVLPCNLKQTMAFSSSDAQAYVAAHKDIYSQDGYLLFAYTPAASYNWNLCKDGQLTNIHMSDKQVSNYIMTNRPFMSMYTVLSSLLANNNSFRGFCSGLGAIFLKDSDAGTKILDTLTGNYNYLDALNYDEDNQTITMSNNNGSVDKLKEEIKKYYYESIGVKFIKPVGTVKKYVDSSDFRKLFEYEDDYTSAYSVCNANHAFVSGNNFAYFSKDNKSNMTGYYYMGNSDDDKRNSFTDWTTSVYTYRLYSYDSSGHSQAWEINNESYSVFYNYEWDNSDKYTPDPACLIPMWVCPYYGQLVFNKDMRYDSATTESWRYRDFRINYYSNDNSSFKYFASYSAMYNFINGDQNAYLSSTIEKTGEDITFSIKDMNENLGNKLDTLIDSINSNKSNMSADELQNAIDKGLEDLNKNTEDIKDNTSDILDTLKEQNNILLQILGVTEYIAYQTTKDDGSSYTKTDLTNTINKIYNGLGNAILYGKNTLTDSGDSSGAASQSSIVTREDFKLSNNIYTSSGSGVSPGTPVVAYSLDDYSVYDDSNDYDVGIAAQDINNMDIHDGLFGKFPFSVPYQLYEWLQVLQADPVAPKFVYNYGFLIGHKGEQKYDLTIDLSIYESWANVCKSFLRLAFTLAMSLFLYKKFKGNSIF
ncbi:hypothetical protein [Lachnospira eligens]|jgi:hypothetical protein|uniref:hypothetical protein n=1 Tax=Lachnospira eligens TaxID=39485 RepID=UPI000E5D9860|nr:hypothetical protein [Lachnospira eligens]RGZ68220.1 hypothetical protein DW976_14080 [Lachnospira eligens]